MCVCLYLCLRLFVSVCLSVFVGVSTCVLERAGARARMCMSLFLSVCLCLSVSVCVSVCVCVSLCLSPSLCLSLSLSLSLTMYVCVRAREPSTPPTTPPPLSLPLFLYLSFNFVLTCAMQFLCDFVFMYVCIIIKGRSVGLRQLTQTDAAKGI